MKQTRGHMARNLIYTLEGYMICCLYENDKKMSNDLMTGVAFISLQFIHSGSFTSPKTRKLLKPCKGKELISDQNQQYNVYMKI